MQRFYVVLAGAFQQIDEGVEIVAQVSEGLPHALADEDQGSEVHDAIESMRLKSCGERIPIVQVADDEFGIRVHRRAIPRAQVVVDDNLIAALDQHLHDMAADITGTAGH